MFDVPSLLALIGVLVPLGAFLWEFVLVGRKRLGYRVQMDTIPAPEGVSSVNAGVWRLEGENGKPLVDPSFVLLRIANIGTTRIVSDDYLGPKDDPVGIRVRFPGRRVAGIVPIELSEKALAAFFSPAENGANADSDDSERQGKASEDRPVPGFGIGQDVKHPTVRIVTLPGVILNRSAHYKVLVALERAQDYEGKFEDPEVIAGIVGGVQREIRRTEGRTGIPRWVTGLVGILVFVSLSEPFVLGLLDQDVPLECAAGDLTLVGSTAFEPVLREAAGSYERTCPDANFAFDLHGSVEGVRTLDEKGREQALLAFSDGTKDGEYCSRGSPPPPYRRPRGHPGGRRPGCVSLLGDGVRLHIRGAQGRLPGSRLPPLHDE